MVKHKLEKNTPSSRTRLLVAGAVTTTTLAVSTLGQAPVAGATCVSVSGLTLGTGCSSAPLSIALALGPNAKAKADKPFTFALNNVAHIPVLFELTKIVGDVFGCLLNPTDSQHTHPVKPTKTKNPTGTGSTSLTEPPTTPGTTTPGTTTTTTPGTPVKTTPVTTTPVTPVTTTPGTPVKTTPVTTTPVAPVTTTPVTTTPVAPVTTTPVTTTPVAPVTTTPVTTTPVAPVTTTTTTTPETDAEKKAKLNAAVDADDEVKQATQAAKDAEGRFNIYKDAFTRNRDLAASGNRDGIDLQSDLRLRDLAEKNFAEANAKLEAIRYKVAEEILSGKRQPPAAPTAAPTTSAAPATPAAPETSTALPAITPETEADKAKLSAAVDATDEVKQAQQSVKEAEGRVEIYTNATKRDGALAAAGKGDVADFSSSSRLKDWAEEDLRKATKKLEEAKTKVAGEFRLGKRPLPAAPATEATPGTQKSTEKTGTDSKTTIAPDHVERPTAFPQTRSKTDGDDENSAADGANADSNAGSSSAKEDPTKSKVVTEFE